MVAVEVEGGFDAPIQGVVFVSGGDAKFVGFGGEVASSVVGQGFVAAIGVDLCVGCTYKYGNSGPGSPAWLYVAKRMQNQLQVPIQGWFAQEAQFEMGPKFDRAKNIRGFQIASPSLIGIRCVQSAFKMIEEAGIKKIANKAAIGTQLMIDLFDQWLKPLGFELNTPRDPNHRGGHISLIHPDAAQICVALRTLVKVVPAVS